MYSVGGGSREGARQEKNKNSKSHFIERTVWGQRKEILTTDMNEKF